MRKIILILILILATSCSLESNLPERTIQERNSLPEITEIEVWEEEYLILEKENFAPDVIQLSDGTYKIYYNSVQSLNGIGSATSEDGFTYTKDEGARLEDLGEGQECTSSHPWLMEFDNGYRMYYTSDANCAQSTKKDFRIYSAFSEDGINFEREGVLIEPTDENGLDEPAHGRIIQLNDGTYRMYFSTGFIDKIGPSDIIGATSEDGLTWVLDDEVIIEDGHDPTVYMDDDNIIHIYTTFLSDNMLHLISEDGYNFEIVSWVEFYNNDQRIEDFGDIDIIEIDGELYIFGSGKGSNGISIMKRIE